MKTGSRLTDMPQKSDPAAARARAEALFKPRPEQQAAAPTTVAEHNADELARPGRMHQRKTLRLPRETPTRDD